MKPCLLYVSIFSERFPGAGSRIDRCRRLSPSTRTADPPSRPFSTEAARKREESLFYAFDLLHLNGNDLR